MITAPGHVAEVAIASRTFRATNRTAAHLEWTIEELERRHPGARLQIIQTCYHTGFKPSAGTHDFDGVFDVSVDGLSWWTAQRFFRECGWAAWYRHTGSWAAQSKWHIHMCSIPPGLENAPTLADVDAAYAAAGIRVGQFVPAQVDDYFAHALGLAGQHRAGDDESWFPDDIAATIFEHQEDDMAGFSEWPDAEKQAFGEFIQEQVRATLINVKRGDKVVEKHLGALLRELEETQDRIREDLAGISGRLPSGTPAA
jgi:hypothetical protein